MSQPKKGDYYTYSRRYNVCIQDKDRCWLARSVLIIVLFVVCYTVFEFLFLMWVPGIRLLLYWYPISNLFLAWWKTTSKLQGKGLIQANSEGRSVLNKVLSCLLSVVGCSHIHRPEKHSFFYQLLRLLSSKNVNNCWISVPSNVLIKTSCCIAQIIYIKNLFILHKSQDNVCCAKQVMQATQFDFFIHDIAQEFIRQWTIYWSLQWQKVSFVIFLFYYCLGVMQGS